MDTIVSEHIDFELLLNACQEGNLATVSYYLENFIYTPEIYGNNNQCLSIAYYQNNMKLVILLCEYAPNLDYFIDSAKFWPQTNLLLTIIQKEKTKRFAQSLQITLKEKNIKNSIKI